MWLQVKTLITPAQLFSEQIYAELGKYKYTLARTYVCMVHLVNGTCVYACTVHVCMANLCVQYICVYGAPAPKVHMCMVDLRIQYSHVYMPGIMQI